MALWSRIKRDKNKKKKSKPPPYSKKKEPKLICVKEQRGLDLKKILEENLQRVDAVVGEAQQKKKRETAVAKREAAASKKLFVGLIGFDAVRRRVTSLYGTQ
eukprot:TRINITY_DN22714_c0_g1_i1.p1 TRINITY_DN22714_c0_g1~~TRINITY_DN22714_c0_g1_i1.p1  ORF type:complete len:102 (+),score=28.27 TRINITY_DN22714_c0_g1_i1:41-346(+)